MGYGGVPYWVQKRDIANMESSYDMQIRQLRQRLEELEEENQQLKEENKQLKKRIK